MITLNYYDVVLAALCIAGGVFVLRTSRWGSERERLRDVLPGQTLAERQRNILLLGRILGGVGVATGVVLLIRTLVAG